MIAGVPDALPLMYTELASWWPLLSAPEHYEEEAEFFWEVLSDGDELDRVLELGSGGGNIASWWSDRADLTLVDLSPAMLAVSAELNPGCEHVVGDLREVRLGRTFDAVFVHDAICYMTTAEDLRAALVTAFEHCTPGAVAVFAPDQVRDTFDATTDCGGEDAEDGRGLRYLEWVQEPEGSTYAVDYAYVLREPDGSTRTVHDRHVEGLFSVKEWIRLLIDVGFEPDVVAFEHSEVERELTVFRARRPE